MRILEINYEFPPVGGGGGRVTEDLSRELAKRGHEVRVQTAHLKGLPKMERRDGYSIYRSMSFRRRADQCGVGEMAAFIITNFIPTLCHILKWKPDVLHIHFAIPTGVLGLISNLITGVPYVITAHLGDIPGGNPEQTALLFSLIKPFTTPVWHRAAAITVHSQYTKDLAFNAYGVSSIIIPNGMDMSSFQQVASAPHDPRRLIFAGRFIPQKNPLFMIDVLDKVKDLSWQMDMFGDGPLMDAVKGKIHKSNLDQRINLHGWVSPEELDGTMREGDILCLPSLSESMPIVAVRALGHGLAILASDIRGIYDIVKPGVNGSLCPVNEVNAFTTALRSMLLSEETIRNMKKGSILQAAQFDSTIIARQYEQLFRSVVSCAV
jgi:glycosyltransferase involved in cell wall biosynthesis